MPLPLARHDKVAITASNVWTALGPAPSTSPARVTIAGLVTVANRGVDVTLDLAIGTAAVPNAEDFVVAGVTVSSVDEWEKRPLIIGPGEQLRVRVIGTGTIAVAAHLFGEECDA